MSRAKSTVNDNGRVGTAMSRNSRMSRGSGGSGQSSALGSVKRQMNSLFQHYMKRDDDEGERQVQNPYDSIFGRSVVKKLKDKSTSYVERLTFQDFKDDVPWTNTFPDFITDLIIYLTGLNLHEYLHIKHMRDQEERD